MKGTDTFKLTVKNYLDNLATKDKMFAKSYMKENKNIEDCITYILTAVRSSGCNGFSDEEIFGMAIHYYDEDTIKPGNPINCQVIVNHQVELTEEEKQVAKQNAIKRYENDAFAALKKKQEKRQNKDNGNVQLSLF